ncbi:cell surface protein [Aspergillus unguis]
MPPKSGIVVPLYIYPLTDQTWAPLYAAIEAYPTLSFLVIINPNSGPGNTSLPDENYTREISRLNNYPNVCMIGYIRIDYCNKPLQECLAEINQYASWTSSNKQLSMHGIFLDETPNHHTPERAEYLDTLTQSIKSHPGIQSKKLVVHNPGTAPAASLACLADLVIVCEESYTRYRSVDVQRWLAINPIDRENAGFILSGVPVENVGELVQELRHRGAYIFVTELAEGFYERFGRSWDLLMQALAE